MPLVKPDEEPSIEQVRTLDQEVQQKAESFWTTLRTVFSKIAGVRGWRPPKFVRAGWKEVWKPQGTKPGFFSNMEKDNRKFTHQGPSIDLFGEHERKKRRK